MSSFRFPVGFRTKTAHGGRRALRWRPEAEALERRLALSVTFAPPEPPEWTTPYPIVPNLPGDNNYTIIGAFDSPIFFGHAYDSDPFKLHLDAGSTITLTTQRDPFYVEVFDPSGASLIDVAMIQPNSFTAPVSGDYIVTIYNTAWPDGPYDLTMHVEPTVQDLQLLGFRDGGAPEELALEYNIASQQSIPPFTIGFFASLDGRYDSLQDAYTGFELEVSPDFLRKNSAIVSLLVGLADDALKPGGHTLLIRPRGTALGAALENPDVEVVLAVADPRNVTSETDLDPYNEDNTAVFRGFYQGRPGERLVVRPGPDTEDVVIINPSLSVTFTSEGAVDQTRNLGIGASTVADVLVVSGNEDDRIVVNAALDVILNGGDGDDAYVFQGLAGGTQSILEAPGSGGFGDFSRDSLDFSEFGEGIKLDLSMTSDQQVSSLLAIRLREGLSIEEVWGTKLFDVIFGNMRPNFLYGDEGDDHLDGGGGTSPNVLVGGLHNDTLIGSDGTDVLIGDDYELKKPELTKFVNNLLNFKWSLGVLVVPVGAGRDDLKGGAGTDVLIGGEGFDTLDSGSGGGILLGDDLKINVGPEVDLKKAILELAGGNLLTVKEFLQKSLGLSRDYELFGSGRDTITGGDGSELIVGGGENDTIDSGGGLVDILFGNDGNDTIDGQRTLFDVAFGGDGDDVIRGPEVPGAYGSLLIGDDFTFTKPSSFFNVDIDFDGGQFSKVTLGIGLISRFEGKDTLSASESRYNVMIGGDGDDRLTGSRFYNFVMGDSINLGAEFSIDFAKYDLTLDQKLKDISDRLRLPGLHGKGADTIELGGAVVSIVIAGGGDDEIVSAGGSIDVLFGNGGNDVINGGGGLNFLVGGEDDDTLVGGDDGNIILGDTFDFSVTGIPALDAFFNGGRLVFGGGLSPAGSGMDTIISGAGSDLIIGGDGDDVINTGDGLFNIVFGDSFHVGLGPTLIIDLKALITGNLKKTLSAFLLPFSLDGDGKDQIFGGSGIDVAIGGDGNDTIITEAGVDALFGNEGNDRLEGGFGIDLLYGGDGDDVLMGGSELNYLYGEGGHDVFAFRKKLALMFKPEQVFTLLMADFDPNEDSESP